MGAYFNHYLDGYLHGEQQAVWDELVALGAAVREEPLYSDALAVARETSRRARVNIETLIPRLVKIGYRFGYGWLQPYARDRLLRAYPAKYDPATGKYTSKSAVLPPQVPESFTFADRMAYQEYLEQAQSMPPLFMPATDREEQIADYEEKFARVPPEPPHDGAREAWRKLKMEQEERSTAAQMISEYESAYGVLPLSVRAWYEIVESVNFVGDHDGWRALVPESAEDYPGHPGERLYSMRMLGPLFVQPLRNKWNTPIPEQDKTGRGWLRITDEDTYKFLEPTNDPIGIPLPNTSADATLYYHGHPQQTFVTYLRECFRWGGFPGWARLERRPEDDLAFLTQGLLPL
jgi:hypothetical protein